MDRRPLHLAVAVAATLATLLVCELASRVLLPPPRYHREPVELDSLLGFRGIPHYRQEQSDERGRYELRLNSHGLRGRELPVAPAPREVSRIAFVGDSFLVGQAVREEELATSRVEAALRSLGREAEVYNLSTVDFGTAQELLLLRELGRPLGPEAVVLFVYPANDLVNNSMRLAGRTTVSAGDPIRPYLVRGEGGELEVRTLHPLRALLRRHSHLFAALERRVLATVGERSRRDDTLERLRQGAAPSEDLEIFRPRADPRDPWTQAWETTFGLLRAFRGECDAMGARLLVVVVPSVYQVVRTPKAMRLDVSARSARGRGLDSILDWNLPERTLGRFFAEAGIEGRLLLDPLREAAAAGERVYTRDEHLAPRGHEIAAASVLGWLTNQPDPAATPKGIRGGPVRALPDASDARLLLDFRVDRHLDYLGDGWIAWTPAEPERPAGWRIGPSALAVLPARDGDLILRGWAPEEASYPIAGSVALVGGPRHRLRIERPGRFAFRVRAVPRGVRLPRTADGYLAVIVAPGEMGRRGSVSAGLLVEALGLEPADAADSSAP